MPGVLVIRWLPVYSCVEDISCVWETHVLWACGYLLAVCRAFLQLVVELLCGGLNVRRCLGDETFEWYRTFDGCSESRMILTRVAIFVSEIE
ncbi:hypothetical protein QLX08_002864 [Tetragonisca angustula]|uniref:Uncharacterized protein n=1 Tax=Tetragonisca angustula TaxID=166442 RepID=A0AAW1ABT3_9HYME